MALSHNEGVQSSRNSAPQVLDHLGYELELAYAFGHELTSLPHPGAHRPSPEVMEDPGAQGLRTLIGPPQTRLRVKGRSCNMVPFYSLGDNPTNFMLAMDRKRVSLWAATTQTPSSPGKF